nr:hypothetical protein [Tanacetum cinerariifolium]
MDEFMRDPQNYEKLKIFLRDIIRGIIHLHDNGVVQGDIPRHNILVKMYPTLNAVPKLAGMRKCQKFDSNEDHTRLIPRDIYGMGRTILEEKFKDDMGELFDISPRAHVLVQECLAYKEMNSMCVDAKYILNHFYFWEDVKYLEFLQRVTDAIHGAYSDTKLKRELKTEEHHVIGKTKSWRSEFDVEWLREVGDAVRYDWYTGRLFKLAVKELLLMEGEATMVCIDTSITSDLCWFHDQIRAVKIYCQRKLKVKNVTSYIDALKPVEQKYTDLLQGLKYSGYGFLSHQNMKKRIVVFSGSPLLFTRDELPEALDFLKERRDFTAVLAILNIEASQSKQHGMSESISYYLPDYVVNSCSAFLCPDILLRLPMDIRLKVDLGKSVEPGCSSSNSDKRRARVMVQDIEKKLFERRLIRNMEKFVGGREYGNDIKLLERTI